MRRFISVSLIFVSILIFSSCKKRQPQPQKNEEIPVQDNTNATTSKQEQLPETPAQPAATSEDEGKSTYELFDNKDPKSISYAGYTIIKTSKQIQENVEGKRISETIPYSILKKDRRL